MKVVSSGEGCWVLLYLSVWKNFPVQSPTLFFYGTSHWVRGTSKFIVACLLRGSDLEKLNTSTVIPWCEVEVDKRKQLEQTPWWFIQFSFNPLCTWFKDFLRLKKWRVFFSHWGAAPRNRCYLYCLFSADPTAQPPKRTAHAETAVNIHQNSPSHLFSWSHGLEASCYIAWSGANWQQTCWLFVRWPGTL